MCRVHLGYQFLYDTLVIDILVVVVWDPAFLNLPDSEANRSVTYHFTTIPKGMVYGRLISAVATAITWFLVR